ncbi:MAG: TPM domain-containing protein [Ignavibacteriales bacterium]|nr:TPM domain-containing protein [Ignavibacteriales bacterium]
MDKCPAVKISLVLFLIIFLIGISSAQQEIPIVRQRVNDASGTLTPDEIRSLERNLAEFEQATSNQIVVLMISSLEGEDLKDYAFRFAETNKIGKKERNNGVFLLIVKKDRKIDIEVGYGLEGVLTDAVSSQIIRKIIGPKFRDGDFYGGLTDGIDAIISVTKGEFKGEAKKNSVKKFSPIIIILLILFFGVFPRIFGGGRRSSIGSTGYRSNFPWWWGGFGGGGFGSGGGFSGGSFGGGGGFGGFSGGGSFGGGGASGSW